MHKGTAGLPRLGSRVRSALALLVLMYTPALVAADGAFLQDAQGLVSMEAESFSASVPQGGHEWLAVSKPAAGFSGTGTMRALPEDNINQTTGYAANSPRLDYPIQFNRSGTHYLWVRALGPGGGSNSVHLGLNGQEVASAADIDFAAQAGYVWTTVVKTLVVPSAGVHALNLWMRESGSIVDKIVVTSDPGFLPTGTGPAESPLDTSGGGVNNPPVLATIGAQGVSEGSTLSFPVSASDADGLPPLLTVTGLPTGASFIDNGSGSGSFSWPTVAGNAGVYTVTFKATDAVDATLSASEQVTITVSAASSAGTGSGAFLQDAQGLVSMEAESFSASVPQGGHEWLAVSNPAAGYSGTGTMRALPEDNVNRTTGYAGNSPRLDYSIQFNRSGTHYLWVRAVGPGGGSNSVHLGLNGQEVASAADIDFTAKAGYVWTTVVKTVVVPSTGVHTLNLWMRESGSIVDKIVVTSSSSFVPSGSGPAESPRGASTSLLPISENFDDGAAQGWVVVDNSGYSSDWRVMAEASGNQAYYQFNEVGGKFAFDGSYHLGTYSYLSTASGLADFRLRVEITSLSAEGQDVGVLFRYQGSGAYYRLSFNAAYGFTRLEKKVNGTFTTLARDSRGHLPKQTMVIVIEAKGPLIQVFRDGDPIMAVRDTSLTSGTVGLYARGAARFDNLTVVANATNPLVAIEAPLAYSLYPNGPRNLSASAIALNAPSGASVAFQLDGQLCGATSQPQAGRFVATCANAQPGEHVLEAILRNAQLVELHRDTNSAVGVGLEAVGSNHYLALGDSITNGVGDNFAADNRSADGRSIGIRGWPSVLGELLTATAGYPNLVANEGTPGDRSDQVLIERLPSILERNPLPNKALILIGTNDSNNSIALPSGAGCNYEQPGGCDNTFKGYLLDIISDLPSGVEAIVSLLPPAFGEGASTSPILDPLNNVQRTQRIHTYNQVIEHEVVTRSGVRLGADLFSCFLREADGQGPAINRFSLFKDNLHANGLGQRVFAKLLHDALNGGFVQPGAWCPAPIYILEDLAPYTYKQNLLEVGDTYYVDAAFTLTQIPAALTDAIWVMTANAHRTKTGSNALSVKLGSTPVTVYVAYDANAIAPGWLATQGFTATSMQLQAIGGAVTSYRIYQANNRSGVLTLPGNRANGGTGGANYLVAVSGPAM